MIRPARPSDLAALRTVAEGTAMFVGDELARFVALMDAHLAGEGAAPGAALVVATSGDGPAAEVTGAAYYALEGMAQGVMNLLFVGVRPDLRNAGIGRALVDRFEADARASGARLAIIETASAPMFAPAWALYRRAGYVEEARIRDFYDEGLDKLVYRKRLGAPES